MIKTEANAYSEYSKNSQEKNPLIKQQHRIYPPEKLSRFFLRKPNVRRFYFLSSKQLWRNPIHSQIRNSRCM